MQWGEWKKNTYILLLLIVFTSFRHTTSVYKSDKIPITYQCSLYQATRGQNISRIGTLVYELTCSPSTDPVHFIWLVFHFLSIQFHWNVFSCVLRNFESRKLNRWCMGSNELLNILLNIIRSPMFSCILQQE